MILHGSRSGSTVPVTPETRHGEFVGTSNYAVNEPNGYGWNATIGDDEIAVHMAYSQWGWNARGCSPHYLGVEFAQAVEGWPITDGQVRAFCWFFSEARKVWPALPTVLPTHSELDGILMYGPLDGKTDVFHRGADATLDLRARIVTRLNEIGVSR